MAEVSDWRRNLVFVWIAQVLSLAGFSFAVPFAPFYLQELGIIGEQNLRLWSGLFMGGAGIAFAIMAPVWGFLADRLGPKSMSLRAALAGAFVLLGMGLVRTPGTLIALRMLQGVFTGTTAANLTLAVFNTPKDRIGFAIGVMNSAVFAGNAIGPLVGGVVADTFGIRVAFYLSSVVLLSSFGVLMFLVDEQFSPRPLRLRISPLRLTRRPLAELGILFDLTLILLLWFARFVGRPIYPLMVLRIAAPGLGVATQTGMVNASAGVAAVLAGVLIGRHADWALARGQRIYGFAIICALLAAAFLVPQGLVRAARTLIQLVFAAEFCTGGLDPLLELLVARKVPPERRGVALGLASSARTLGWSAGSLVGGVLAAYLGFPWVFLSGALVLVLLALLLQARRVPRN